MSSSGRLKWERIKSENGFEHDGQALLFAKEKGLINDSWVRDLIERVGVKPGMTRAEIADLLESDAQNEKGHLVQLAKEMTLKEINLVDDPAKHIDRFADELRARLTNIIKAIQS
jgi:hypothetical protein